MKKNIWATDAKTIGEVLKSDSTMFEIPQFQRTYTWKTKNIDELWTSLIENDEGYFIGNMVWIEDNGVYKIIDGQQRLITISLILIALKDLWKELLINCNDVKLTEIINRIINHDIDDSIFNFKIDVQNPPLRIHSYKDNIYIIYKELASLKAIEDKIKIGFINGVKVDENQKIFIRNYKFIIDIIRKEIEQKPVSQSSIDILKIITSKVSSLLFIPIYCNSDVDAYKIFEGLNNTGISLSAVDLVKNAVMSSVTNDEYKIKIEKEWQKLECLFESTNINIFNKYLRHYWIATIKYVNSANLFKEIKINKLEGKTAKEIYNYVYNLNIGAGLYLGFRHEDYQSISLKEKLKTRIVGNDLKKALISISRFKFLNVEQAYEVLLAITFKFIEKDSLLKYKDYTKIINNLWVFLFRCSFVSVNPSGYENIFANLCTEINRKTDDDYSIFHKYMYESLSFKIQGEDKDKDFIKEFSRKDKLNYVKGDNSLISYILHTIVTNEKSEYEVNSPTIEHILPQNPNTPINDISINEYKKLIDSIGNLTCLNDKKNNDNSNLSIEEKCEKVFSKDIFDLNKIISIEVDLWKKFPEKQIKTRAEKYAEIANNIWRMSP